MSLAMNDEERQTIGIDMQRDTAVRQNGKYITKRLIVSLIIDVVYVFKVHCTVSKF